MFTGSQCIQFKTDKSNNKIISIKIADMLGKIKLTNIRSRDGIEEKKTNSKFITPPLGNELNRKKEQYVLKTEEM